MARMMGSVYLITMITTVCLGLILIMIPLRPLGWCVQSAHDKLKAYFLWNFVIRLVFEACLELTFAVIINLAFVFSGESPIGNWLEAYDRGIAFLMALAVVLLPLFILWFYCKNFEKMDDPEF